MDRWVCEDVPPPVSRHPQLADGTLVPHKDVGFPILPGVHSPSAIPGGYRADLKEQQSNSPLPFLVPKVDSDGNELSGIRMSEVSVPLGTYTGWNFRNPSIGQPDELLPLTGSYIPFAVTRSARERNHDPRLSVEERYANRATYLGLATAAALKLIQEGYILSVDLNGIMGHALTHWDDTTRGTPLTEK